MYVLGQTEFILPLGIALAMVYDLAEAQERLLQTLRIRGCFDPGQSAYGTTLHNYLHAIQLSILFVARQISIHPPGREAEQFSPLWHVPSISQAKFLKTACACLRKTLTSLEELLTSPLWSVLCRPHLLTLEYDDTIEVISRLADYDHSRHLVTSSLIDALREGLLSFQLVGDNVAGIDEYILYLCRARCKSQIQRLKRKMNPAPPDRLNRGTVTDVLSPSGEQLQMQFNDGDERGDGSGKTSAEENQVIDDDFSSDDEDDTDSD